MEKYEVVEQPAIKVRGISTITNYGNEMDVNTARIAPLWEKFWLEYAPHFTPDTQIYGVYDHYESDYTGDYRVTAAVHDEQDAAGHAAGKKDETHILLPAGKYAKFSATGELPQACIDLWGVVWETFNDPNCAHERTYTTDYEHYTSEESIDIYISIK